MAPSDAGVDSAPSPDVPGGDTAGGCAYRGTTYPVGANFAADDGCNSCTCLAGGGAACTEIACPRRDGGSPDLAACDFSARYSYGTIGGLRVSISRTELAPENKYTHTRSPVSAPGSALSCSPAMPPCGAQDVITAYDIEVHDLGRADVQAALAEAQPPLYGYDSRPVDGTLFEFKRADGRGFLVGDTCDNRPPPCRPIPAGVAQLAKRLQDLDKQQLAAPECATLRP
jgi:Pacifastin inhibitor (LCMII)